MLNFMKHGSNQDTYVFSGNSGSIETKAQEIDPDTFSKYKSLRFNITGTCVQSYSACCFWGTIIIGSILIFPIFFLCCDWWKRRAYQIHVIDKKAYESMIKMINKSNANELYIRVQDNNFNQAKALLIIQALQNSQIKNFIFKNIVSGFDWESSNYSGFLSYMKPIKQMSMSSQIEWDDRLVV